jgi:hypothetical protein
VKNDVDETIDALDLNAVEEGQVSKSKKSFHRKKHRDFSPPPNISKDEAYPEFNKPKKRKHPADGAGGKGGLLLLPGWRKPPPIIGKPFLSSHYKKYHPEI